jgi:hypothetical protein
MEKNKGLSKAQRRAQRIAEHYNSSLSSGLGRAWKERRLVKAKDKRTAPVTSGGLPSLGKNK